MQVSHQLREAFKEPPNLLGLATLVALSAAMLTLYPAFLGAVAEIAYLLFVPRARWYRLRCAKRDRERQRARLDQLKARLYPKLHPDLQQRYGHLAKARSEVRRLIKDQLKDQPQFNELMSGVDSLLKRFLILAAKEVQFRTYLNSTVQFARKRPPVTVADGSNDVQSFSGAIEEILLGYEASKHTLRAASSLEVDPVRRDKLDSYSGAFVQRAAFIAEVAEILAKLQGELEKIEAAVAALNDHSQLVSSERALSKIGSAVFEVDTILKQHSGFEVYEWLMVRPEQPIVQEIPDAKLGDGPAVNTRRLLVSFGLLALTIIIFGFGADTINDGLKEYFHTTREVQHWESWELGALIWTAGFAIWFYLDMPLTKVDSLDKKIVPLASVGVALLTAFAGVTIWLADYRWTHVFFVAAIACLYCWLDQTLSKNVKDPHLSRNFNDSKWLADIPAVVAFGVLVFYQVYLLVHLGGKHYGDGERWALFFSGAISFQLVVSTVIFALVQSGAIRKFLYETEARDQ